MTKKILAGLLVCAVAACSDKSTGGDGGGTAIISFSAGDPGSLFPLLVTDEVSDAMTDLLFEKLAAIGPDLSSTGDKGFTPRLAKSWDWSKDSLQITFHIDPAARFHDGTPVTAKDVQYTFRIAKDTALGSTFTPLIANIDSVSVSDSVTATFWYHRRSTFQFFDAVYQIAPVPEHVYGKVAVADLKTSEITRTPIGSGRFRFVKWEPNVSLELMADTANFLGRAKLDRVIFMLGQAPTAAAQAVLTGESDFYIAFPIDQVDRLDSNATARAVPYSQNGYGFLAFNMFARKSTSKPHPILGDVNVRRALSMSLDREAMLKNVFKNTGRIAYGPFPTGVDLSDTTLSPPPYDTAAAGKLLDAAGWKRGPNGIRMKGGRPLTLEILTPTSSSIRMRYSDLLQGQLNKVGFNIEIARVSPQDMGARAGARDYDMMVQALFTDPSVAGIQQFWGASGIQAGSNFELYKNAAVDAALDSAAVAVTPGDMHRLVSRAFKQIIDDAPAVWLYSGGSIGAAHKRLEIPFLPRDGWWGAIPDWSIPADKRIDRDRIGLRPAATP